jgi:hypothetical protein
MIGEGTMGTYYADAGPEDGTLMYGDGDGSIDVFEDPACSVAIGTADCIGWDAAGAAVWRVAVADGEDLGPSVLACREFIPTRPDWRKLYPAETHRDLGRTTWASRHRGRRPGRLRPARGAVPSSAL